MSLRTCRGAALGAALALVLVACGGGDGQTATATDDGVEEVDEANGDEGAAEDRDTVDLRIGGGQPGSAAQVMGVGLSELLSEQSDWLRTTVVGSAGVGENLRLLESAEVELGHIGANQWAEAMESTGGWEGEPPYEEVLWITGVYQAPVYVVTRPDSGIESIWDLEGKTVAMGPAGGVGATTDQIMDILGIEANREFHAYDEANTRMAEGQLDAAWYPLTRFPALIELETIMSGNLVFLGIDDPDAQQMIMDAAPASGNLQTVPAESYEQLEEDLDTVGYIGGLAANRQLDDDVVYEVTRQIWENEQFMAQFDPYPEAWAFDLIPSAEAIEAIGGKMHPGAIRFYREVGVDIPSSLEP